MPSLKGKLVEVCKGHKITVGTVGKCLWHGHTKYGWRVQVQFEDGTCCSSTFMNAANVRPLEGQPVQQSLFGATAPAHDPGDIPF
jgi:hypothetical protein